MRIHTGNRVRFWYTNWRGTRHLYEVIVESVEYTKLMRTDKGDRAAGWYLHSQVLTRDGNFRPEMGDNRRRSFLLDEINDLVVMG